MAPSAKPEPFCIGCNRFAKDIPEYRDGWKEYGASSPEDFARDDGTYNPENGHFTCTDCYIKRGMPTAIHGWRAS